MILICSKQDDAHALKVAAHLKEKYGCEVFVFDSSSYPNDVALTGVFGNHRAGMQLTLRNGSRLLLQDVSAFWWRRPQPIMIDPRITDDGVRSFTFQECISALYGLLLCTDALWVNDIQSEMAAEYKPYQLKVASENGFQVPETLITSRPEDALEFWNRHDRKVVYKAFNQRGLVWRPTRMLTVSDLAMLENLRFAPVIFQPLVKGIRDIRVTVIGERIFATEFDIEEMNEVDHRVSIEKIECRPHKLPAETETAIHGLMSVFGLEYGGLDLRLTPESRYVFFEINTAGEFLYLEKRTGQPIADAMAAHLAGGRAVHKRSIATTERGLK